MFIEVRCIEPTHLIFLTSTGQDKPWHDFRQNQMTWPHYFQNLNTRCLTDSSRGLLQKIREKFAKYSRNIREKFTKN